MYLRRGGVGELRRDVRPQEQTANELLDGLLHAARTLDTARAAAADEDSEDETIGHIDAQVQQRKRDTTTREEYLALPGAAFRWKR